MKNSRHYLELLGISQFISKEGKEQRQVTASIVHQQPDTELDPWALPWGGGGRHCCLWTLPAPVMGSYCTCNQSLSPATVRPMALHWKVANWPALTSTFWIRRKWGVLATWRERVQDIKSGDLSLICVFFESICSSGPFHFVYLWRKCGFCL